MSEEARISPGAAFTIGETEFWKEFLDKEGKHKKGSKDDRSPKTDQAGDSKAS